MEFDLSVHIRVYREQFLEEHYRGQEHILAMVWEGAFLVEQEKKQTVVRQGEGFVFLKDRSYFRKVLSPVTLHLFRYSSQDPLFLKEHLQFEDAARVRSTLLALESAEQTMNKNLSSYKKHLFSDLLFQHWAQSGRSAEKLQKEDPSMEQALLVIHRSLGDKLSLSEVAASCGLSYAHFYRRFCAFTGRTPSQYIAFCRLQKAKELLAETSQSIQSVADSCGFENEYYFSNFFKKQTGLSPTGFRHSLI